MISLMEIEGGSFYDENDKRKPNLYQKISALKQKKLSRSINFAEAEMNDTIKKAQDCLKKVNTVETRSKIEKEKFGNTSQSVAVQHYKRLASFYFFVTMIGYIDSKIKDEVGVIDFNSKFLPIDDACNDRHHYDKIDASREKIAAYILDRNEILEDFKSVIGSEFDIKELIDSVLKESLSYLKFGSMYEKWMDESHKIDLLSNFISAYNVGLLTKDYYGSGNSYGGRLSKYRELFSDYTIHSDTNNYELNNVKVMNKK